MEDEVWVTEDGRRIPVGDLDLNHARNIIRMLLRKRRERVTAIKVFRRLTETKEERVARAKRILERFENWDEP